MFILTELVINGLQCILSHSASCTRVLDPVVVVVVVVVAAAAAAVLAGRDFVVSAVPVFPGGQHQ